MADFSASSIIGATLNTATLKTLLESLPARYSTDNWSTLQSVASGSWTTLKTMNVTVAADEALLFLAQASVSCGTVGDQIAFRMRIDSTAMTPKAYFIQRGNANVDGNEDLITMFSVTSGLTAGSKAFDLQWSRNSGSGTLYSLEGRISVFQFKMRS